MVTYTLEQGARITYCGSKYRLGQSWPNGEVELLPEKGELPITVTQSELNAAFARGALEFVAKAWDVAGQMAEKAEEKSRPGILTLDAQTLKVQQEVKRRQAYLAEIPRGGPPAWLAPNLRTVRNLRHRHVMPPSVVLGNTLRPVAYTPVGCAA